MGLSSRSKDEEEQEAALLLPNLTTSASRSHSKIPEDSFHFAYIIYFTLGAGYLLPWNAFITAVDYFSYLYPDSSVDRVFAVVYMLITLVFLLGVIAVANNSYSNSNSKSYSIINSSHFRINVGLLLFMVSLLVIPVMDVVYIKGRPGLYPGYCFTIAAVALSGVADALVQGGVIGSAGELPERYMQAVVAGTAASGVLVSVLRIITKSIFPQDTYGLRRSAILYFVVGIVAMAICIVFHNVADRLPVIRYYKDLKMQAVNEDKNGEGPLESSSWRSTLGDILSRVKWFGFGIILIYMVTLSIFPGFITEDVHSQVLKDWYPILLITSYNVFDLVGKCLTALYLLENVKVAVGACVARLLFYPLFFGCLHGPKFFRSEFLVAILTCLLGMTNGYFTSVLMIMAPKAVQIQHSETAGVVIVLFLIIGLAFGSVVAWFWVI
ncbi:Equilibrative nucleoside transporter [Macleaya cordata]|uniref:Equilibrative nucleoside transporter n=1 Tax=Macleaya cordata TaxID=56857 RepID=A0A200PTT3_MACCD|nr:Equilibrative nucleoside transporter [Macleaya cordata]